MAKIKPQLARLLYVDKEIRTEKFPNCSSIAKEYEVSSRTIQRDIEYMKDMLKAPIEYSAAKRGFYYSEENYMLPSIDIKESEFFGLYVAEKALEKYKNTPIYDKLSSVFEKLQSFLPDEIKINTSWIDSEFTFLEDSTVTIKPEIWEILLSGLRNKKIVEIYYKTPGKDRTKRDIKIYHMINHSGQWYVLAYCNLKKTILLFALSRIDEALLLKESYEIPQNFDFHQHMGAHFGIMIDSKEFEIKIRFSPSQAPYVRERTWHKTQSISERKDGSLDLTFSTNSKFEVKRWIMSWGKDAKVLKPKDLAIEIEEDLKRAIENYKA